MHHATGDIWRPGGFCQEIRFPKWIRRISQGTRKYAKDSAPDLRPQPEPPPWVVLHMSDSSHGGVYICMP